MYKSQNSGLSLIALCGDAQYGAVFVNFTEVFAHHLPDIEPDNFEDLLRPGLNVFENGNNLGYNNVDFNGFFLSFEVFLVEHMFR